MPRFRTSPTKRRFSTLEHLERRALMSGSTDLTIANTGFADAANQPPAVPGARFYIQPSFEENGLPATRPLPFSIYLSPTPSLTDQSIRIYSRADGDLAIWAAPTWRADAWGELPAGVTPGTWYPIVVVDPDNAIPESDETNNTLIGDPVTVTLPQDDLVAPTVSAPAAWPAGTSMNVFNSEVVPPGRLYPVTIAYSLSVDEIAGNADDIAIETFTVPSAGYWHPGGSTPFYGTDIPGRSVALPASLPPGTYHLVTTIDPDNAIAESDETNNATVGPVLTVLPADTIDLTAWAPNVGSSIINPPTIYTPGSQISIGAYPYSRFGQSVRPKVAFILSSDDTYGNDDDIFLGSYDANATTPTPPGLIVCYAIPTTLNATLPATLAPGQYKLFAVVDPDNEIAEYDETNNVSVGTDITIHDSLTINDQYETPVICDLIPQPPFGFAIAPVVRYTSNQPFVIDSTPTWNTDTPIDPDTAPTTPSAPSSRPPPSSVTSPPAQPSRRPSPSPIPPARPSPSSTKSPPTSPPTKR